jgi:hypothetical protein
MIFLLFSMVFWSTSQAATPIVEIVDVDETPEIATSTDISATTTTLTTLKDNLMVRWTSQSKTAVSLEQQVTSLKVAPTTTTTTTTTQ